LVDAGLTGPPRPLPARDDDADEGDARDPESVQTFEQLRARFKLRPGSTVADPALLDHLAYHAIERRPDRGFVWRSDPNLRRPAHVTPPSPLDATAVSCPMITLWGRESPILKRVTPTDIAMRFPNAAFTAFEIIEGAHHHVFLDQPAAFNTALLKHLAKIPT
jgi:pimeloyl-ACP methyl ester carboxylesterase